MPDSSPATDFVIQKANADVEPIDIHVTKNDIEFVCAGTGAKSSITLWIRSRDAKFQNMIGLSPHQLRDAAVNGIVLRLEPARDVQICISDNGRAVPNAHVFVDTFVWSIETTATTDADGQATLQLPAGSEIGSVAAWTDDHRIGAKRLYQKSPLVRSVNRFEIQIVSCKPHRLRVVDRQNRPVASQTLNFGIGGKDFWVSPRCLPPVATDDSGEATIEWFPDLPNYKCWAEPTDDNNVVVARKDIDDDLSVVTVAPESQGRPSQERSATSTPKLSGRSSSFGLSRAKLRARATFAMLASAKMASFMYRYCPIRIILRS